MLKRWQCENGSWFDEYFFTVFKRVSITDVGSGSLKINFETAFSGPDKYSVVAMGEAEYSFGVKGNDGQAADSVTLQHGRYGGPYSNTDKANVIVAS